MALLQDLDIVNAACAMIGEEPLQSLDDETDAGQATSLIYQTILEFNLGLYLFSFSKQVRQLSKNDAGQPLAGYTIVYDMPAERIGDPIYVTDDPTNPYRRFTRYAIVNTQIHADQDPLYAMIRFRPSPHTWTATFKAATIKSVASQLAIPMTHDRALAESLSREAYGTPQEAFLGGMMRAAIRADSFSTPPRSQNRSNNPLENAWRGSR